MRAISSGEATTPSIPAFSASTASRTTWSAIGVGHADGLEILRATGS